MKRASIAIFKNSEGKILVGKRLPSKRFGPPGGKIEENETPFKALIREVKEETGIELGYDEGLVTAVSWKERDGYEIHAFFLLFKEEKHKVINTEPDKCEEWVWMKPEDVVKEECVFSLQTLYKHDKDWSVDIVNTLQTANWY
jgi:8-oxo-dGTP pyrophosphatase MutT (NUDIX family)